MRLAWKNYSLDLSQKTHIMGILNVTPDSFSDRGRYFDKDKALAWGVRMVSEGADMIDVGGESTRPGSGRITAEEELKRVVPVIELLAKHINVPISIDTYKAQVAQAALEAGASMINDVSGLRFDSQMASVAARYDAPIVIMHIKGSPETMQLDTSYSDLITDVMDYLRQSSQLAIKAGVSEGRVILDPGIGFGKNYRQNLEILNKLSVFQTLGFPLLIGPSRKAFIGAILDDAPTLERLEGTIAATAIGIMNGAHIVRAHDVKSIAKAAKVADAIKRMDY
jgi:dihydropteroate synthase